MSQQLIIQDIARRVYAPLDNVFVGIEEHLTDQELEDSYGSEAEAA